MRIGELPDETTSFFPGEAVETHPWLRHADLIKTNPRTSKGKKFPKRYLKGLTKLEKEIAKYEIDRGYEFDTDDPEAYKMWKSDIKAKARGMKTMPSKYRLEFVKKYGPLPSNPPTDELETVPMTPDGTMVATVNPRSKRTLPKKLAKATGIKEEYIQEAYDKV